MAAVTLVGLARGMAELVEAALRGEGHTVTQLPLDADTVRTLGRARPDVLVLDGHAYVNTGVLLADLQAQPETSQLPVVLLGPARAVEVPHFEVVERLRRSFELGDLLAAVQRAAGEPYTG